MQKQVVLITGASSGIGEAAAIRLHKKGFTVYAGARRVEKMRHLEQAGIHLLALDVSDDGSMQDAVAHIIAQEGRIDVLINNAGYGSYGALEDVPLSEGKYQFEVNVFGLARLTQLALPYMRNNQSGKIVNISSIGGRTHEPLGSWYHATKYAVEGMSDCLRLELKDMGIDVIIIEPGGVKSEWSGIASDSLLKVSGHTAYRKLAVMNAKLMASSGGSTSDPDVVARTIEKSLLAKKPKTRYLTGSFARFFIFMRFVLTDRGYDRFHMFITTRMAK
ncbi:oxidoreductase [Paenibacillus sepulcri]